jgi:outer membrane protein assembly factor BamE (lipoprotein component of BamABCDE complex)
MKTVIFATMFCLALAGCANLVAPRLEPGTPADTVRAQMGTPTHVYQDGDYTVLEYARGPSGQYTFMARIDAQGKLASFEQVLSSAKFATVKIGKDNKETILHTFGQPAEVQHYPLSDTEAWLYRYKEQDIWNSIMYVQFYPTGMVKSLQSGPDPEHESSRGR